MDETARGAQAFTAGMCFKCHGDDGRGGNRAPDLTDEEWIHCDGSLEGIRAVIVTGVSRDRLKDPVRPFPMNPATNLITDDQQISDLALYVHNLSRN